MKRIINLFLLALTIFVSAGAKTVYPFRFAPSTGMVNEVEKPFRQELCLNGYWDFQPVKTPSGYKQGAGVAPELPEPSDEVWVSNTLEVPSPWNINSYAYRNLEGPDHRNYPSYPKEWDNVLMGWLKKTVIVPADWAGEEISLSISKQWLEMPWSMSTARKWLIISTCSSLSPAM